MCGRSHERRRGQFRHRRIIATPGIGCYRYYVAALGGAADV